MVQTSTSYLLHPQIDDCVIVTIPQVDRPGKLSVRNIIGIIAEIIENQGHKFYNVATKYGCIRPLLLRNQFEMCRQTNVLDTEAMDRERTTTIRQISTATAGEKKGGDAAVFCCCATDFCRTRRCICRRRGVTCTKRCQHGRDARTGRINKDIAVRFKCNNRK